MGNLLLAVFFSICAGFLFAGAQYNLLFLLFIAPLFLFLIFKNNELLIWALILSIFLLYYLSGIGLLPDAVQRMTDVVTIGLFLKVGLTKACSRERIYAPFFVAVLSALLLSILTSLIIFKLSFGTILIGFRNNFRFVLFFYLLINLGLEEKFFRRILKVLFFIALFQIPVTIIQKLTWNPSNKLQVGGGAMSYVDISGGTLGAGDTTGTLACFLAGVIYMLIAFWRYKFLSLNKLIVLVSGLFIPFVLAQSGAAFIIFPLGVFFVVFPYSKIPIAKRVLAATLIITGLVTVLFFSNRSLFDTKELQRQYYMQVQLDAYGGPAAVGKIASIYYVINLIHIDVWHSLFGYGLGSASASQSIGVAGGLAREVQRYELKPQLTRILLEMGWVGVTLLCVFLVYLWNIARKVLNDSRDNYWKAFALGFYGAFFLFISFAFYRPIWLVEPTAFSFAFLAAALYLKHVQWKDAPAKS